jgi:hypothetical protein
MPDDLSHESLTLHRERQARAMLDAIGQARSEHLTYDQMEAWVEDQLDQTARELVMAHTGLCEFCAKQLASYESYAPVMSGPIAAPAQLIPFRERFRASFRWPQAAMVALAIAVAILAPVVIRNSRSSGTALESLASLPPSLREAARDVVNADAPLRPVALADLAPNVDPQIEYPASEVVEETQPELRWKPFAATYTISISDSSEQLVAQATGLANTQWIVSAPLNRGAKYTWEVRASISGEVAHRASFRVLGDSEEQTLAQLRASGAGPLALGAVAQQFGLLSMAESEFEKLAKDQPRSQDAAKLLEHVTSLRGR